jgi:Fanconi anemia group M protein
MQRAFGGGNVIIYADTRESNTRIPHILKKLCDVREKQLLVGDYILSERVCIERKTTPDFVQSIIDKRLFSQLETMKANYPNPVLIVEGGDILDNGRDIHPNAVRGAIAAISVDYAVPMIWTATQMDTAHQLFAIAKREQLDSKKSVGIRNKKKQRSMEETQEFLVAGIPKISTAKARALLKHFRTPERMFTASEADLMKVEGIGCGLARQIRRIMTEKYK